MGAGHAPHLRRQHQRRAPRLVLQREFFIDNLLVRVYFIIVMIRWTGLAPWEFEFPFPGSLTSTFPVALHLPLRSPTTNPHNLRTTT